MRFSVACCTFFLSIRAKSPKCQSWNTHSILVSILFGTFSSSLEVLLQCQSANDDLLIRRQIPKLSNPCVIGAVHDHRELTPRSVQLPITSHAAPCCPSPSKSSPSSPSSPAPSKMLMTLRLRRWRTVATHQVQIQQQWGWNFAESPTGSAP